MNELAAIGLVLLATSLFAGGLLLARRALPLPAAAPVPGTSEAERVAESVLLDLTRRAHDLKAAVELLDEQRAEYFFLLYENGAGTIDAISSNLALAIEDLGRALREQRIGEFHELARFLKGEASYFSTELRSHTSADLKLLVDWDAKANAIIVKLVERLDAASSQTRDIGVVRKHKRIPTIHAVNEIKNLLNKNRKDESDPQPDRESDTW